MFIYSPLHKRNENYDFRELFAHELIRWVRPFNCTYCVQALGAGPRRNRFTRAACTAHSYQLGGTLQRSGHGLDQETVT